MESYWNRKTFCLVTGASKGIGRCIAIEFAKTFGEGSVLLLIARSVPGLERTKQEVLSSSRVKVTTVSVDLGKPDPCHYTSIIESCLMENGAASQDFENAMIVQNAASLGIESGLKVAEMMNLQEIQNYYAFNLNSFIILNAAFFKTFSTNQVRSIVHISSGGVVAPFKTWGLYCAAKAARNMLLRSMALESGINALNWAPGCVDTDIYEEAVAHTADPELAKFFEENRKAGKILTCQQTVSKLMKVLASGKFVNGEHVSYDDFLEEMN